MSLNINWIYKNEIISVQDLFEMVKIFKEIRPDYASLDTETNGLHIIYNKPFVLAFAFANFETKKGASFVYDLENNNITEDVMFTIFKICKKVKKVAMHNATFDLHMLINIHHPYPHNNITDSMFYIRFAHDAIPPSEGGVTLDLKSYATKYITFEAKKYEQKLKEEQHLITIQNTNLLAQMLRPLGAPPDEYKISGKEKYWTKAIIENFLSDKLNEINDLPYEVQTIFLEWKSKIKDPQNYANLNRENVKIYAHFDVIFVLEIIFKTMPVLINRKQEKALELEEKLIPVLIDMERVGFKFNMEYALKAKQKLKNYILLKRKRLEKLAGCPIKIGQHKLIGDILYQKFNITKHLNGSSYTTGDQILNIILDELKQKDSASTDAIEFIKIIIELRTLEKWYSTYIVRLIESVKENGRIYTTINQVGAVSGRVSSDFQQFPRTPILDDKGNELFHPRKLIQVSGNGYNKIAYLDYSQIELRFQAIYTIYVMGGDTNLCRAYIPFKCHLRELNEKLYYDSSIPEHRNNFKKYIWYLNEEPDTIWYPTDLHDKTTLMAFPSLNKNQPEFNEYRRMGKSTNFACIYGATEKTLKLQFHYSEIIAKALYNGFKSAFPGVIKYREYVRDYLMLCNHMTNLFGVKYYGTNYHKMCNYLIQGSAASFLKLKMIEVYEFLKKNNCKSRFQMNIHDEMSFEIYENEEWIIEKLKNIMETLPNSPIPIIADIEITESTWADKRELNLND